MKTRAWAAIRASSNNPGEYFIDVESISFTIDLSRQRVKELVRQYESYEDFNRRCPVDCYAPIVIKLERD